MRPRWLAMAIAALVAAAVYLLVR